MCPVARALLDGGSHSRSATTQFFWRAATLAVKRAAPRRHCDDQTTGGSIAFLLLRKVYILTSI